MRQAVITRHGAADVFEMRESPDPVPGPGEIRVRVRAAGINFADILARIGLYPDAPKPPLVVGYEVFQDAVAYVGVRRIKAGFENGPDVTLDKGAYVGVSLQF